MGKKKDNKKIMSVEENASVAEFNKRTKRRHKWRKFFLITFITVASLFLVFSFTAPYIFRDQTHWTYHYFVENTLNVRNIAEFFQDRIPLLVQSAMVIVIFYVVINLLYHILTLSLTHLAHKNKRTKTVVSMIASFTTYIGYFIMILALLKVWGMNTTAILSGAAVFSAVIA